MLGVVEFASRPIPVEELQGPDFIPIVIVGLFLVWFVRCLFKS
ncbi:MAG: hypothetical protein QOF58_3620 [Pseudonocardiales bacterium]|jgi:hypothetical protein|nr:hypothetical protein [Pseudonocardiales bacterium]